MKIKRLLYWYLISVTGTIVFAHFLGAAGVKIIESSQATHLISLMFSYPLLMGLLYKSRWAFSVGIFFYSLISLNFPFETFEKIFKKQQIEPIRFFDWTLMLIALTATLHLRKSFSVKGERLTSKKF